jgi:hypothetical protein
MGNLSEERICGLISLGYHGVEVRSLTTSDASDRGPLLVMANAWQGLANAIVSRSASVV